MEIEVKRRRLKSIGLGILAGTFLGMGGMKSAEAINNAWWTDTPETLVTGQIKTTDIEDNETIGTADNYYIINGNGNIGLNNRENAILTVSQGTVNYSEVNGGIIEVSAHGYPDHTNFGSTNHTTVRGGGMLWVMATANDNKIYDSTLYVANAGFYSPHSGDPAAPAIARDNYLYGKSKQLVSLKGKVFNTELNDSSTQTIYDTGIGIDTTVNDTSYSWIKEGGKAQGYLNVNDKGIVYLDTGLVGGGYAENVTLNGGDTRLNLRTQAGGSTTVDNLAGTGGVQFTPFPTTRAALNYGELKVGNLSGSLRFVMRTDIVGDENGNNTGDLLNVTGTTAGSHKVAVLNSGSTNATGDENLRIIKTADGNGNFSLNQNVELGGYEYELEKRGTDWYLHGARRPTSSATAGANVFSGGYLLNYAETQTLLQRLGNLRQEEDEGNIWAKAFGGEFNSSGDGFLGGYSMTYGGLQVGADKKFELKNKAHISVGGFFGYANGDLDYGLGNGSVDSKSLGVYGTYMNGNGFYTDLVLKHVWMKNDFSVLDSAAEHVSGGKVNTNGFSGSLEIGKRYHLNRKEKQGWYVEPQAQISGGHQKGGTFDASNGLKVEVDGYTSLLGRMGANIGYEVKKGKNPVNGYLKISRVHEFDGDVNYQLNGSKETTSYGDSWWTWGLGVTAQINKKHNLYLDIERSSGGQFSQPWAINGGYRILW